MNTNDGDLEIGVTYDANLSDCCVKVAFRATLLRVVGDGEVDELATDGYDREVGWPYPRTYWSNGLVCDGYVYGDPVIA